MSDKIATYVCFALAITASIYGRVAVHFAINKSEELQIKATNDYMFCESFMLFLLLGIIAILAKPVYNFFSKIVWVFTFLAFGKVLDELFFDPTAYHWNDLLIFNIALVIITVIITRHLTTKK